MFLPGSVWGASRGKTRLSTFEMGDRSQVIHKKAARFERLRLADVFTRSALPPHMTLSSPSHRGGVTRQPLLPSR